MNGGAQSISLSDKKLFHREKKRAGLRKKTVQVTEVAKIWRLKKLAPNERERIGRVEQEKL